jgi:hypothetical protein
MVAATLAVLMSQDRPPTLDHRRLLNVGFNPMAGHFEVKEFALGFPASGVSQYDFVLSKSGTELQKVTFEAQPFPKYPSFINLTPNNLPIVRLDGPGDYEYTINADGNALGSVKFSAKQYTGSDPFNPESYLMLDGPWANAGVLEAETDEPEHPVLFEFWSQVQESGATQPPQVTATLLAGGAVKATTKYQVLSDKAWYMMSYQLYRPGNEQYFTRADLLALNGDFEVVIKHGDKRVKSFKGTISSGAFKPGPDEHRMPRTMRYNFGELAPAKLHEAYWLTRSGS